MPSALALSLKDSPEKLYGDFPDLILRRTGIKTPIAMMARAIAPITTPAMAPPDKSVELPVEIVEDAEVVALVDDAALIEPEVCAVEMEAGTLAIVTPGGTISPGLRTNVEFAAASF